MKAQHVTTAVRTSSRVPRMHWLLSILGIVTAIVCLLVLINDFQPAQQDRVLGNLPNRIEGIQQHGIELNTGSFFYEVAQTGLTIVSIVE